MKTSHKLTLVYSVEDGPDGSDDCEILQVGNERKIYGRKSSWIKAAVLGKTIKPYTFQRQ